MNIENGQALVNNVRLTDLCEKYGTPLYVYDGNKIVEQYKRMKNAIKTDRLKINYAIKALNNLSILRLLHSLGAGLDTVSIEEVHLGLMAGFEPENIVYTPNMVSREEVEEAIKLGVKINIDNISTLEYIGHKYERHPLCIRINPHIMAGGNENISVGHIDSKFGISIHQMPLVNRLVKALNINVEGVHMHTGSDILDINVFLIATDLLFDVARNFADLKYIDFGSGFKVKYKPEDYETDIEMFGDKIGRKFEEFCEETGKDLTLMFEPGKFLVSESGYLLVQTNLIKQTTSTVFAGVNSGFNHLIRPMLYNAYHRITNISNPEGEPRIYTLVGYICETDTFGYNRRISEIRLGDYLALHNAGAYGFTMASNYNSRLRPAEALILDGKDYLIRRRETLSELTHLQVIPEILK